MCIAEFYENNAGYIYAVITNEDGELLNICEIPDGTSLYELNQALKEGYAYADPYDPDDYNGVSVEDFRDELENSDGVEHIATMQGNELAANCTTVVYPDVMGCAGKELFQIEDNE